jgi:signal transduction histidine kinase
MAIMPNMIIIFTVFSSIALSVLVFFYNRRSPVNKFFSLYSVFSAGWIITLYLFYSARADDLLFFGRLNFAVTEWVAFFGFYFGYWFPVRTFKFNRIFHPIAIFWLFVLTYATLFTGLIDQKEEFVNGVIVTHFGSLYILFIMHFLLFIGGIIYLPVIKYGSLDHKKRMQVKYLSMGTSLSIIFAGTTNILLPFLFKNYNWQYTGPLGLIPFYGFTSYSIIRHNLMDIKLVIQRSLVYSFLISIIIGVYLVLVFLLGIIFGEATDSTILLAAIIVTLIGIYTVPHIERYFLKITDKFFFKDKYDYSQALFDLADTLSKNIRLDRLLAEASGNLQRILKSKSVEICLVKGKSGSSKDKRTEEITDKNIISVAESLGRDNISIIRNHAILDLQNAVASEKLAGLKVLKGFGLERKTSIFGFIVYEGKLLGIILVGDKISGDEYTDEDVKLLKTFVYQASIAIMNAQLYQQVVDYSTELEKRVEQRTETIFKLQEEQKQMMLEIAHSLQTPLTILKAELNFMAKDAKDKRSYSALERSIDRISNFIYDLLRLANLESGVKADYFYRMSLSDLLDEMVENFEIIMADKNISFKHKIEKDIYIIGAKKELEELVNNLVSNSMKYIGPGSKKEINIELATIDGRPTITIADNGLGIKPEYLPQIFKRFYRAHDSIAGERSKGAGLGLAICKEIVARHNAEIYAQSKEGKGTKMTIIFK